MFAAFCLAAFGFTSNLQQFARGSFLMHHDQATVCRGEEPAQSATDASTTVRSWRAVPVFVS